MRYATVQEPVPERLAPYVTTGYKFENGAEVAQPYEIIGGFRPAGSGAVSALDMTHFMLAHLQAGRYGDRQILEPATVELMHTTAFQLDPRFPGMALGFYHADINGRDAFGLAPYDMTSDPTLRPGDVVATKDGFQAFGGRSGASATSQECSVFTASWPIRP